MRPANDNQRPRAVGEALSWPGPVALLFIGLIRVYRYSLSALVGRTCRFLPTCSEYGEMAIRRHGAWRGGWLTLFRLMRCRPGAVHGYDPVPDTVGRHGWRFWLYAGYGPGGAQQAD